MGQSVKPADSFQGLVRFSTHIYIYCQPNFAHLGRSSPSHGAIYLLSAGGIQDHHAMGHVILHTQLTKSRWPLSDVIFTHCLLRQMSMSLPECKESLPEEKMNKDLISTNVVLTGKLYCCLKWLQEAWQFCNYFLHFNYLLVLRNHINSYTIRKEGTWHKNLPLPLPGMQTIAWWDYRCKSFSISTSKVLSFCVKIVTSRRNITELLSSVFIHVFLTIFFQSVIPN